MQTDERPTRADIARTPRVPVSVRLMPSTLKALDAVARKTGVLRSEMIENTLRDGLGLARDDTPRNPPPVFD